ncbi:MAG TPA: hypothetical protein VKG80_06110 [Trebonia sp.]|nr:hypothetical protein [Trebonia sp.]
MQPRQAQNPPRGLVFDVAAAGVMREICHGAERGTTISVKAERSSP